MVGLEGEDAVDPCNKRLILSFLDMIYIAIHHTKQLLLFVALQSFYKKPIIIGEKEKTSGSS